jgi:hypothetical protein
LTVHRISFPYGQIIKTAAKMGSWSSFQGAAAQ